MGETRFSSIPFVTFSLSTRRRPKIIVLDQTKAHLPEVVRILEAWHRAAAIRWLHLPEPLIPRAMNRGLIEAKNETVLFLDDDILPEPGFLQAHASGHQQTHAGLVAGRIIQPWQEGSDFSRDNKFHFACCRPTWIEEFMAGNFSIRRDAALKIGGFDERFVRVAYNFEAEFAYRWRNAGHKIYFEPVATVHHLRVSAGGTRMFGEHLRSFRPNHAVGAYYYYPTHMVGKEKHVSVSQSTVACDLHASSPSPALVDSGDTNSGVFRHGLGAGIGVPRTPLCQSEGR